LFHRNRASLLYVSMILKEKGNIGWGLALVNVWLAYGPDFSGEHANPLQCQGISPPIQIEVNSLESDFCLENNISSNKLVTEL